MFGDNDSAGEKWENELTRELCRKLDLRMASVNPLFKDVNEWGDMEAIRRAYGDSTMCRNVAISIRCTS